MTWDEAELRAALRDGEGETLSPGHIMAIAEARQQRRHERLRTAAVAVVVTGLLGGGVGVLTQLSGNSESGSSASADGAKAAGRNDHTQNGGVATGPGRDAAGGSAGSKPLVPMPSGPQSLTAGGMSFGAAADCPKTPPAVSHPAPTAPGAAGPLFTEPVASLTICGYRERQSGAKYRLRGATMINGAAAQNLVAGLEQASMTPSTIGCPGVAQPTALILQARSEAGAALAVVRIDDNGCATTVTNGTAVRYAWQVPKALAELLD